MFCEKAANVVDTTSADDTFTGYFIAGILAGNSPEKAMKLAARGRLSV